jgi:hypothetical protein
LHPTCHSRADWVNMKLEDLAYAITLKVFDELEHKHHYVVPKDIQKKVIEAAKKDLDQLIK